MRWFPLVIALFLATESELFAVAKPSLIAHRGASYLAPEGTAAAFLMARELGADYLEADIRRTSDGEIVILHDSNLARTTDVEEKFPERRHLKYAVDRFTLKELQILDAGSWFNRKYRQRARESFRSLKILTLKQLIEIAKGAGSDIGLYLEFKEPHLYPGIEKQVHLLLKSEGWLDRTISHHAVIYHTFDPESIQRLAEHASEIPRVYLYNGLKKQTGRPGDLKSASQLPLHGIAPFFLFSSPFNVSSLIHWGESIREFLEIARESGLIVHPWVVNFPPMMRLFQFAGVDGFFTDRIELATEVLGRNKGVDCEMLFLKLGFSRSFKGH